MLLRVSALAAIAFSAPVAAEPPLIPLADFARAPDVRNIAVSPDGTMLAMIVTVEGRGSIALAGLDGRNRRIIYRDPARSIGEARWSADGRWLYFLQDAGGDEGFHLFSVDPQMPGSARDLTPFRGATVELINASMTTGSSIPITLNRRDAAAPDPYLLDLTTGELREQFRNDFGATEFLADRTGRVAAATAVRADGRMEFLARGAGGSWQVRYTAPAAERFAVLKLDMSGRTAFARTNRSRSAEQLVRIDLASGRINPVARGDCGRFDVADLHLTPADIVWAIDCVTERPDVLPRDRLGARALAAIRRVAGPTSGLRLESTTPDRRTLLFYADASDRPGRYFLWTDEGGARQVAETYPWLAGRTLAPTRAHWLRARDGLELLAYVTQPPGRSGPVPMVVPIHGGPWSRDTGGYGSDTQMLANRGYAVLQVNFRGSTGLGRRTFDGGVGEFGRRMSDDIDDAVAWAVRQGIADRHRICLLGGSYGGYATLMGLVREPARYRCGIDYAGPVDLATLVESFPPGWGPFLPRSWYRFVGDPRRPGVRDILARHSPLTYADTITAPLLVFQGVNDPRVTRAQSDRLVCALRRRGVTVEYLLAGNEGHSFGNEETSLAVNRSVELFLAARLGGRSEPSVSGEIQTALEGLRRAGQTTRC